jgi:hypothetical protein
MQNKNKKCRRVVSAGNQKLFNRNFEFGGNLRKEPSLVFDAECFGSAGYGEYSDPPVGDEKRSETRVARWYVLIPKIPNWVNLGEH